MLAFEAIYPEVYPVAIKLFESGDMDKYYIAARIFKQFSKKWDVPENELHTAMIDLTITCAEQDYKNSVNNQNIKGTTKNTSKTKSNICNIHNCKMEMEDVMIVYGMPASCPPMGYDEVLENEFPNCDGVILGGCCVEEDKYVKKYICKKCNSARDKWKKDICGEIMEYGVTSHNRIVYASPPKGGSGSEKPQSG
jgi:hypothetical protein